MRPIALSLAVLLLAGCAFESATSDSVPEVPPPAVRPGVPLAVILDESMGGRALLGRLAEPVRVETEAVENRHVPGQTDTLRTYVYDGLALEFYDVTGGGPLLQEVTVTGEGYATAEGLGSTRAEVEAVYTNSTGAEGSTISYEQPAGPENPTPTVLRVRYDGDRAEALTWAFYVD